MARPCEVSGTFSIEAAVEWDYNRQWQPFEMASLARAKGDGMAGEQIDCRHIRQTGIVGMIVGAVVALGVPVAVLGWGSKAELTNITVTILSGIGIAGGVAVSLTSAFFSLVTPPGEAARKAKTSSEASLRASGGTQAPHHAGGSCRP